MADGFWWVTMSANLALLVFNGCQLVRMMRYQQTQARRFDRLFEDLHTQIRRLKTDAVTK